MLLDVGLKLLGMNICKGPTSGFKEVLIITIYFQTGKKVKKKSCPKKIRKKDNLNLKKNASQRSLNSEEKTNIFMQNISRHAVVFWVFSFLTVYFFIYFFRRT